MEAYTIRKARMSDVKGMHRLLMSCAQRSQLLPRSLNSLYGHVRDFYVVEEKATGKTVGCCALTICWEDLAEIRSLALDDAHKGRGLGKAMVDTCLDEARELGLTRVFALTYVVDFFKRCGFSEVEKDTLPQKVWTDCLNCPKFPECDETAMLVTLKPR